MLSCTSVKEYINEKPARICLDGSSHPSCSCTERYIDRWRVILCEPGDVNDLEETAQ